MKKMNNNKQTRKNLLSDRWSEIDLQKTPAICATNAFYGSRNMFLCASMESFVLFFAWKFLFILFRANRWSIMPVQGTPNDICVSFVWIHSNNILPIIPANSTFHQLNISQNNFRAVLSSANNSIEFSELLNISRCVSLCVFVWVENCKK